MIRHRIYSFQPYQGGKLFEKKEKPSQVTKRIEKRQKEGEIECT